MGEKFCPDFCFLPQTCKAGLGAAENQTFTADLKTIDINPYYHIFYKIKAIQLHSGWHLFSWHTIGKLLNSSKTPYFMLQVRKAPSAIFTTPSFNGCQYLQGSCWVRSCYLGTQEHGLVKGACGHLSDRVLFVKMDWGVTNQMPFQGTVENTEIFNEALWNEIDT